MCSIFNFAQSKSSISCENRLKKFIFYEKNQIKISFTKISKKSEATLNGKCECKRGKWRAHVRKLQLCVRWTVFKSLNCLKIWWTSSISLYEFWKYYSFFKIGFCYLNKPYMFFIHILSKKNLIRSTTI